MLLNEKNDLHSVRIKPKAEFFKFLLDNLNMVYYNNKLIYIYEEVLRRILCYSILFYNVFKYIIIYIYI